MPPATEVAAEHYAAQQRQIESAVILARRAWRRMDPNDLDRSWAQIVRRLMVIVGSAQLGAARAGAAYVPLALGQDIPADGRVNPDRLAGVASDGRALDTLLYSAVIHARQYAQGAGVIANGADHLEMLVRTQVADAGRVSAGVAIAARPHVEYVRMVSPPCCQRCAVLAGKHYRWNTGFQRHPRCDCRHIPTVSDETPEGYTADIAPDQIKDLTRAQRKAIGDGADTNQVINSHRAGRRSADGMTTTEGATRARGKTRLTPEAIYRVSASREDAVQRLRVHGYIL